MKKINHYSRLIAFFAFILGVQFPISAQTIKDVFTNSDTKIFYYGIDFTKAKLIDDATANEQDIRDRQYDGINQLSINEPDKFDLKAAFGRTIEHDISETMKRNEKVSAGAIKSSTSADFNRFKENDVADIVKSFNADPKNGIGLLFVVEAMSKSAKAAAIWVTLFDPKTKKILMTERLEGKAAGFGFRNYWAGSIKNVILEIKKKKYKEWQSKYGV